MAETVEPHMADAGTGSGAFTVSVKPGNGDGTFRATVIVNAGHKVQQSELVAADVNGDGRTDLVGFTANDGDDANGVEVSSVVVALGTTGGAFQAEQRRKQHRSRAAVGTSGFAIEQHESIEFAAPPATQIANSDE